MKISISFSLLLFVICHGISQQNAISIDRLQDYKQGQYYFDQQLYGPSRHMVDQFNHLVHPAHIDDFTNLGDDATVMYGIAGLRLDVTGAEDQLLSFIDLTYPDPVTTPAILELGS